MQEFYGKDSTGDCEIERDGRGFGSGDLCKLIGEIFEGNLIEKPKGSSLGPAIRTGGEAPDIQARASVNGQGRPSFLVELRNRSSSSRVNDQTNSGAFEGLSKQ